jgi:superfamily II DNA or RNA helicase
MSQKLFVSKLKNETSIWTMTPEYREKIRQNSYIGKKGYTILKSYLHKNDEDFLKEECTMIPFTNNSFTCGGSTNETKFYVYRESENKIYIPRFYGIERYGHPIRTEISVGKDICCPFEGSLRNYQVPIVQTYLNHIQAGNSGGILEAACAAGKCLSKNTPVIMYDGTIKMVQDIVIGEQLMGDDSMPRNVLSLAHGFETMYKISEVSSPNNYTVNKSHILSLKNVDDKIIDISVENYLSSNTRELLMGYRVPLDFPLIPVEDPYLFGLNLNCSIPMNYKCNTRENRTKLLDGIIAKYGKLVETSCIKRKNNAYEIKHENQVVIQDIVFLARSLGYTVKHIDEYCILITNCVSLTYKITLQKLEDNDYYGFSIDGNHRFVLGDFTVTHNTVMGINILSVLKKKTLILVHKEFLMNQWIERIKTFLPSAQIGIIQANVFDIENKDIVIGMIQTMYRKEFPKTQLGENPLDDFGLTIIDEVHRIGSEEFSKTLLRVSTQFMLGISATVDRKDKLTKILYMYIGPKIYSSERESVDTVIVRGLKFENQDSEFSKMEYDYRGNPKYSTMISKLCNFNPRSVFIMGILKDLIRENDKAQIIVLCHNICLLQFLYSSLEMEKFATFGYYKGGMKKEQLKMSEDKQIVLGSYAMASEGLDIPTLSTLVLATPKTDIVQCVGRILRVKRANPLIIDIIDTHDTFQNQWKKRKTYYRKCDYTILQGTTIHNCVPISKKGCKIKNDLEDDNSDNLLQGKCLISIKKTQS